MLSAAVCVMGTMSVAGKTADRVCACAFVRMYVCGCVDRTRGPLWSAGGETMIANEGVEDFADKWPTLFDAACGTMRRIFRMGEQDLRDMRANIPGGVVFCVSDPITKDCPLTFVSRGFEEMTGFKADFALGKNCRFLQPVVRNVNTIVNGEELLRLRSFCECTDGGRMGLGRVLGYSVPPCHERACAGHFLRCGMHACIFSDDVVCPCRCLSSDDGFASVCKDGLFSFVQIVCHVFRKPSRRRPWQHMHASLSARVVVLVSRGRLCFVV